MHFSHSTDRSRSASPTRWLVFYYFNAKQAHTIVYSVVYQRQRLDREGGGAGQVDRGASGELFRFGGRGGE